ncbi:hypothetical protein K239x_27950 [Planctomycetes bacterium K23_9]|uniref:Uncharacterized protein n=1 Tax=Stieleria marina TaxID=1930275 RepID=A0A517NUK7_9BACT|nr:hypothetical protein K239x_27950 [Planctomycetes bacterium K23_9]
MALLMLAGCFDESFDDFRIDVIEPLERQVPTELADALEQSVRIVEFAAFGERRLNVRFAREHTAELPFLLVGLQRVKRPTVLRDLGRLRYRRHHKRIEQLNEVSFFCVSHSGGMKEESPFSISCVLGTGDKNHRQFVGFLHQ